MACSYKRRDRYFEAQIVKGADELRSKREAQQLAEIVRELQDELIPVLVMLWGNGENFEEGIR
jgi:hypothetical protein